MAAQRSVPIHLLPETISPEDAVEAAYPSEIARTVESIQQGNSVLIECDKELTQFFYIALRNRMRRVSTGAKRGTPEEMRPIVIDGRLNADDLAALEAAGERPQGSAVARMLQKLSLTLRNDVTGTVLVLTHLDVLTTTQSGLTLEAREAIPMVYENPEARMIGFKDPSFEIPDAIANLFPTRVSIVGVSRDALPKIVTQREAKSMNATELDVVGLYKYVSGLNAVRLRKLMAPVALKREASAGRPNTREVYGLIRSETSKSGKVELPNVRLADDIAGYQEVKDRINSELLVLAQRRDTLAAREDVEALEKLLPRGIIFFGPPGTGKTLFAKAMATELDATVIIVSGPELKSKWVGSSEENIRRVFREARASAPAVIVFDEIDSFATQRGGEQNDSGVQHSMVNQLLTEMDGFRSNEMLFVVATTNFVESLDGALLRPGRFELHIEIPAPGPADRAAIARLYAKKMKLRVSDAIIDHIVMRTEGMADPKKGLPFTGDHLQALFRGLSRVVLQRNKDAPITPADVDGVLQRKIRRDIVLTSEVERMVAVHEAGHAMVGLLYPGARKPLSIAVTPDAASDSLGGVQFAKPLRPNAQTREDLLGDIAIALGGRNAEWIVFGSTSSGAEQDLEHANAIARHMVERYAMGGSGSLLAFLQGSKNSQRRSEQIEADIEKILQDVNRHVGKLLRDNMDRLNNLADILVREKRVNVSELERLLALHSME